MCSSHTWGRAEISVMKSTASKMQTGRLKGEDPVTSLVGLPCKASPYGYKWEDPHGRDFRRMPAVGQGPSAWGHWWVPGSKQEMPVQTKAPFIHLPSVLFLMTTFQLFFLTSFSGEHLQIVSMNAAQESTGFSVCPQALLLDLFAWSLTSGPRLLSSFCNRSLLFLFSLWKNNWKHIVLDPTDATLGACP